jgi:hypothetical protein
VTQLDLNTEVTVVGRNRAGDWWKICCVNGRDVWVSASVVSTEGELWNVPEINDWPPPPPPPPTQAPTFTPVPTPTRSWPFRLESPPKEYAWSHNYFQVAAIIYNGATPLYGYKLKIRKTSTGQEWLSEGSETYWKSETVEWEEKPTPNVEVRRNVKWDSNSGSIPMGDDVWEVTVVDGAGNALSEPVRLNTSVAQAKWYYLVFRSG